MSHTTIADAEPMGAMNTTPLIDVMLVLLIMFIVTIPIQTHAVSVDLPSAPPVPMDRERNLLTISADGVIGWNGQPVSHAGLAAAITSARAMTPAPELHFRPDPAARYEVVDQVLATAKKARADTLGFVGNERYRTF